MDVLMALDRSSLEIAVISEETKAISTLAAIALAKFVYCSECPTWKIVRKCRIFYNRYSPLVANELLAEKIDDITTLPNVDTSFFCREDKEVQTSHESEHFLLIKLGED